MEQTVQDRTKQLWKELSPVDQSKIRVLQSSPNLFSEQQITEVLDWHEYWRDLGIYRNAEGVIRYYKGLEQIPEDKRSYHQRQEIVRLSGEIDEAKVLMQSYLSKYGRPENDDDELLRELGINLN